MASWAETQTSPVSRVRAYTEPDSAQAALQNADAMLRTLREIRALPEEEKQ